jgi:uncharacterized membrane protein
MALTTQIAMSFGAIALVSWLLAGAVSILSYSAIARRARLREDRAGKIALLLNVIGAAAAATMLSIAFVQ